MGSPADLGRALRAGQRHPHRAVARGERRAERSDLDRRRERRIADQRVGDGQRQRVHRAARRQAVALRAVAPGILHRRRGADAVDHEPAHERDQLGDQFAVLGGAIQFVELLCVDRDKADGVAGLQQKDRIAMQLIGSHRRAAQQMPAARPGEALDAGLHAADRDRAGRRQQPRAVTPRHRQRRIEPGEIGPARRETDHRHAIVAGGVARDQFVGGELERLRGVVEIDAVFAAIAHRNPPVPAVADGAI